MTNSTDQVQRSNSLQIGKTSNTIYKSTHPDYCQHRMRLEYKWYMLSTLLARYNITTTRN